MTSDSPGMPEPVKPDAETAMPMVGAVGRCVGDLVHIAHEEGIDAVKAFAGDDDLDGEGWREVFSYCAEQRCEGDGVSCPGCQRRVAASGFQSLDAFLAGHREIVLGDTGVTIQGGGEATARFESHDHMMRAWAGEPYWFWARRILRKLRYGIRKAGALQADAMEGAGLTADSPAILLMEPQIPDNIGMVARAMGNFALQDLRVIRPRDGWPSEKARAVASGAAAIIDGARLEADLAGAIGDLNWVCATTARQRDMRKPVLTPEQAAAEMRQRIDRGERCGVLFGRERNGLESSEIADCDAIVMIPVNTAFASLNLAQAVLLLGYEWLKIGSNASLGRVTHYERPLETGMNWGDEAPATKTELLGLFEHLESELDRLGFFHPHGRQPVVVRNLRTMFTRATPTAQEVRTLRGIVATLAHGKGKARKRDPDAS